MKHVDSAALLARQRTLEAQVDHWRRRALQAEKDRDELHAAMDGQQRIGAAVGMLMVTAKVPQAVAFQMLVEVSIRRKRTLREVADDMLQSGLPPAD